MSRPSRPPSAGELLKRTRAEDRERQVGLYGDALPAVELLRKRGYVVTREKDKVRVDNKLLTLAEMTALAQREGGLAGMALARPASRTASGLAVGDKVPIVPRKAPRAAPIPVAAKPATRKLSGAAAQKKAAAEAHSTDLGEKPRIVWLDLALLAVDRRYQREIGQAGNAHVNRILRGFNWNLYQPIVVSERADGTYAVIDGQHRLEAAKKHPLIDALPCYIIDAPDLAAQAAIFAEVNSRRLALTSQQKFWAAHAGGDAVAVAVEKICADAGVRILRSPPSYDIPACAVVAPFTLTKIFRRLGRPALAATVQLLAETQPDTVNAFRSPTLVALARIASDKVFSQARLKRTLRGLDFAGLYDDARRDRVARGGHARIGHRARSAWALWRCREGDVSRCRRPEPRRPQPRAGLARRRLGLVVGDRLLHALGVAREIEAVGVAGLQRLQRDVLAVARRAGGDDAAIAVPFNRLAAGLVVGGGEQIRDEGAGAHAGDRLGLLAVAQLGRVHAPEADRRLVADAIGGVPVAHEHSAVEDRRKRAAIPGLRDGGEGGGGDRRRERERLHGVDHWSGLSPPRA